MEELLAGISTAKATEAETNVAEELEDMARQIAQRTAQRAPVLTGAFATLCRNGCQPS